jgi:hypothetical protein
MVSKASRWRGQFVEVGWVLLGPSCLSGAVPGSESNNARKGYQGRCIMMLALFGC